MCHGRASSARGSLVLRSCQRWFIAVGSPASASCTPPKKYDAKAVLGLGSRLLREAGVSTHCPRSTTAIIGKMCDLKNDDPISQLPDPGSHPGRSVMPGMVWMPLPQVKLSGQAGKALREHLLQPRNRESLNSQTTRCFLGAIAGIIAHRFQNAGILNELIQKGPEAAEQLCQQAAAGNLRCKKINTWRSLINSQLTF